MSIIILDANGSFLGKTEENGKIRHFIRDKKVKIVERNPFTVQIIDESLLDSFNFENEENKLDSLSHKLFLNSSDDNLWNYIPLGEVSTEKIQQFGWYLNDENISKYAYDSYPCTTFLITGGIGSGKSMLVSRIISHANKFSDKIQLIGADSPRLEFSKKENQFTSVVKDTIAIASITETLQKIMMKNFVMMEKCQVNNIRKVANKQFKVDYYEFNDKAYQFDEIFSVKIDFDHSSRNYSRLHSIYPDDKQVLAMTIQDIYNDLQNGTYDQVEINGQILKADDIIKTSDNYKHKSIIFIIDEMNELMDSDDFKSISAIKLSLGSIARLGRAAGVHLCLVCQRPSGNTISTDLKNNIGLSILLGKFDSGFSDLMFGKDISDLCKSHNKGRGFITQGSNILEIQTYCGEYSGTINY